MTEQLIVCARGLHESRKMPTLREFMTEALAYAIRDRGFCEAGAAGVFDSNPRIHAAVEEVHAAVDELLERAREVREDAVAGDVAFLIQAIAQTRVALRARRLAALSRPRARRPAPPGSPSALAEAAHDRQLIAAKTRT